MASFILPLMTISTGLGAYIYTTTTNNKVEASPNTVYSAPPLLAGYQEPAWDILDPLQLGHMERDFVFYGYEPGQFGIPRGVSSEFYSSQKRTYGSNFESL